MKLFSLLTIGVFAAFLPNSAIAEELSPVDMAHRVGFEGCDALIADIFKIAVNAPEKLIKIEYFSERAQNSVDFYGTFGKPGDTVWQNAHFEKSGGYCYAVLRTLLSVEGNCADILNKDEHFKRKHESAGALWSENQGQVTRLFVQSGNACNQIYARSFKREASQ